MIQTLLFLAVLLLVIFISYFLWKSGFLFQAEKPETLIDKPVIDAKERRAFLKRLKRWCEEGKLSRAEYEHMSQLCDFEWDSRGEFVEKSLQKRYRTLKRS